MTILDDFVTCTGDVVEVYDDFSLIKISRAGLTDELDRLVRRFPGDWTHEDADLILSETPPSLCGFIVTPGAIKPYTDSVQMESDWTAIKQGVGPC